MLLLNNLEFKRLDKIIFNEINISASAGKIILINGNNGAGKNNISYIPNVLGVTNFFCFSIKLLRGMYGTTWHYALLFHDKIVEYLV